MIIGYVSINKDLLLLFTYEFFLCQRVATVFIYVRYLPLAESGWLYTYLRIEHHAQQNGSHVQLFTETEYVLDPKWTEFRIGSCARSWAWRLNLFNENAPSRELEIPNHNSISSYCHSASSLCQHPTGVRTSDYSCGYIHSDTAPASNKLVYSRDLV